MRKLWILGVIGALALLPFSALADTGDATTATLKLEGVIYITVTDEWEDLTIYQNGENGIATLTDYFAWGDVEIKVLAMTDYKVWSGYFTDLTDEATEFDEEDHVVALDDGTEYWLPYNSSFESITNPTAGFDWTGGFGTDMVALFTGSNNMPTGNTKSYNAKLDPSNLGDRKAGENIQFTIVFVVEDTSPGSP